MASEKEKDSRAARSSLDEDAGGRGSSHDEHVWVLDTETKGTGANMVPLKRVLQKPGASDAVPGFTFRKLERQPEEPQPREPYRFRIVDLMSRRTLAEDVDAREAIEALEPVRSIVDVSIFVWEPDAERWRLLTFDEGRLLWSNRGRVEELTELC